MKSVSKTAVGAIAVSLAAILWGLDGIVLTPRLYNLEIGYVVFMLHLIPFILMSLFLSKQFLKLRQFSANDWIYLILTSLTGGVIGTMAIVKALFLVEFQQLTIVVLLQKLQPVFAITLAAIILKEKIGGRFVFWAGLAILASYFLTFGLSLPNLKVGSNTVYAAMYAVLAAAAFGSATVLGKKILSKYDFKTATFYRYGITSLIMLFYVVITYQYLEFSNTTANNWIIFVVISVTTGSGAIFLYYFGLKNVKASVATICELFFPVSAIVFDYLFNDNRLSVIQWISIAVLLYAIVNLNRIPPIRAKK